jgi:phosphoribosylformylglycinamidine synthase
MDDYTHAVSMDLKEAGNLVYLVGAFNPRLGASHYRLAVDDQVFDGEVPPLEPKTPVIYRALNRAIRARTVRACHDLSEGGLGVAAAEMCVAGRLGMHLEISDENPVLDLFGETNGCFLVEVSKAFKDAFEEAFEELPLRYLAIVRPDGRFTVRCGERDLVDLPVDRLVAAWNHTADAGGR